jgi:spore coat protein U-like protein
MRTTAFTTVIGMTLAGAVAITGTRAYAASEAENLAVSAAVAVKCTVSTTALAFGAYDPVVANASANLDGTGGLTIACTKGASATVALGVGANASGSTRQLANGASRLQYEIYKDSGRTQVWNEAAGTLSTGAAPSKAARNFTVYGRVPANQDVPSGNYADSVVATVNF